MIRVLLITLCVSGPSASGAAEDLAVLPAGGDVQPNRMMHAYLLGRVHEALERRATEYENVKTAEQLSERQRRMREFFVEALGGFPERTPLNPQIVSGEDRDGYRVEKIIFESQPKHFVTGLLYLPDTKPPFPGVLFPCGHSGNGKAAEAYQRGCVLLARNGLAAFCYDPIDQGERFQLLDADRKPIVGGTTAHSLLGVGSALLGRNTATFRVWDGMRALDYLQSRPEIDPQRIGCTGNSGGGTLTSYLMALDERILCAAPSCYLTTLRRLCDTIGPQDAEQNIHGQIAFGMDHPDYVMMRAPKPTLMCAATHDFFDIEGTWDCFRQAKRFYTRLGFAERVDLIETDARHGFSSTLRVGAVRWMRRWLMEVDDAITEPEFGIVSDEAAQCTPGGQVMLLPGARNTYDLNRDLEAELAEQRKQFWKGTRRAVAIEAVRQTSGIRKLTDLPKPECTVVADIEEQDYRLQKSIFDPEPGIRLPALAFVPKDHDGKAYLYLHAEGKQADAAPGGPIEELVRQGHVVLAVDLRGIGETAGEGAGKRGISHYVGGDWKELYMAYLLGTSYLAMRAEDVLVCARFLQGYQAGDQPNQVHVVSVGRTGPPALHAAALEPQLITSLTLKSSLTSWSDVVQTPLAAGQFVNVVHRALTTYDLPDLLATLPKEKVEVVEPLDALDQPINAD
jgi:cephalosporin-C deacetylase-like acetyl esterase